MIADIVRVPLGDRSYEIRIGEGLIDGLGAAIRDLVTRPRVVLVSDETVAGHYLARARAGLEAVGIAGTSVILPPGEASKSFAMLEELAGRLIDLGVERKDLLVALGGGVIGDLVGFAAAILHRGIAVVQVPTSLLAQVDSSVGGKTGINLAQGKNLVGAFHQPRRVLIDLATLDSLDQRQRCAGYAEIVKYGLIDQADFFTWLERHGAALLAGDRAVQTHAIATSCKAKAAIVATDEREGGQRALLNLGHTFGHALEAVTGYDGSLLHGEAVAIGMVLALDLSVLLGLAPADDALRLRRHLAAVGLPTAAAVPGHRLEPDRLLALMARDKKAESGRPAFILARGIGKAFISRDVPDRALRDLIERACGSGPDADALT